MAAQQGEAVPLRLSGVNPGGFRTNATESWGAYTFALTNFTEKDRLARVLVFFQHRPEVQYGRDVWVPAHSTRSSWLLVGPVEAQAPAGRREIEILLYDRTDGQDRLILPPEAAGRVRGRGVPYQQREPTTAILLDEEGPEPPPFAQLPQPESRDEESFTLARAFRLMIHRSESIQRINSGSMTPLAKTFDGIDHLILASNRIADDPTSTRALRHWLQQGGRVWVMLDRVEPKVLAPLLGDALDFQLVDRIGLNSFRIQSNLVRETMPEPEQKHDRPVEFARVLLPAHEQMRHSINGWPLWFTRKVGRGEVVFTTLSYRGWVRPRLPSDQAASFPQFPMFPVPLSPLDEIAAVLQPPPDINTFHVESFQPMLTEEIGYAVIGRGTVVLTFGFFLLSALALGIALRRSSRPELLGWLGPAASLGAAGVFFLMGESSRRSAPTTVAVGQIVHAVSGKDEAAVTGLLAMYRPNSGPAEAGADEGGFFDLDTSGIEGQTRRLILTDLDKWHWENMTLPAGVRAGSFQDSLRIGEPIRAVARFGPAGLEGKITGPCQELADAVATTPSGRNLAIHLGSDGSFRAGPSDVLPKGEFLTEAVLSDRQQKRQAIYRAFLKRSGAGLAQGGDNVVLAWAKALDLPFHLEPEARRVGSALLVVPLQLERSAPGTAVSIPGPFISCQRIVDAGPIRLVMEGKVNMDMHLRFQLPREVLPFKAERARLTLKIDAPSRRVTIAGLQDSQATPLRSVDSPLDPLRLDITDERLLHLDAEGGLHLNVTIGNTFQGKSEAAAPQQVTEKWTIDYLELDVSGRTKSDE
ncbi:MAG TPA: hypothetical protein VKU02_17615 [Gemmataceae bacterium]|nr:hypothetical protein [Gemmataceae bacterium]